MTNNVDQVKALSKESNRKKEKEMMDLITKSLNKMQSLVDTNLSDVLQEREEGIKKSKEQFKQIQLVCCRFFDKYDGELEKISAQNQ